MSSRDYLLFYVTTKHLIHTLNYHTKTDYIQTKLFCLLHFWIVMFSSFLESDQEEIIFYFSEYKKHFKKEILKDR